MPTRTHAARRYDLLALDLDGTVLDRAGRISEANRRAIRRAREHGITVAVCTGRGLAECRHYLEQIGQDDPVVVAGGSILADPVSGRTLHRFPVRRDLVHAATRMLLDRGWPVLLLKDPAGAGYDYLVIHGDERHPLDPVTAWWFESMNVRVRYASHADEDEHPEHSVRLGVCARAGELAPVAAMLRERFADWASLHHFPAVVSPEHTRAAADGDVMHVLEVFDREANKWGAVRWLAQGRGIEPERVAAIGDEINDVALIRGAGLGVAMGNAVPAVRDAARRHTLTNDEDGVAHAIERILSGEW